MSTEYIYENGELVSESELGEAECPVCGYPVVGHFQNGSLSWTEPCSQCESHGENAIGTVITTPATAKVGYHEQITKLSRKFKRAMVCTVRPCPVCGGDAALYVTAKNAMFLCMNADKRTIHAFENDHGKIGQQIGYEVA